MEKSYTVVFKSTRTYETEVLAASEDEAREKFHGGDWEGDEQEVCSEGDEIEEVKEEEACQEDTSYE